MSKMLDRLAAFFRENWMQMLVIMIAVALPVSLVYAEIGKKYGYVTMDTIFMTGCFFLLASQIGKWGKVLMHLYFAFAIMDFALSFGCYLVNCEDLSIDTFYLMFGSNKEEISEFFEHYFPLKKVLIWTGAMVLLCALYVCKSPKLRPSMRVSRVCSIIFLVVAILCFPSLKRHVSEWGARIIPRKYVVIAKMYEPLGKVAENRHDLPLKEASNEHPQHIVLVIGESFSKSHCSIYGYKRPTNPELSKLASTDQLLVFSDVTSPAPFTHVSFKSIFTFWDGNDSNWYDSDTFFDVFCQKYATRWISNQQDHGVYDNAQATFANLCDTVWFASLHEDEVKNSYDENLLPIIRSFASNDSMPSFTIINLMGQHEAFRKRYPPSWDYFNPDDYTEYKSNQRLLMAQYDNATRYNDHVVASIFDIYKDKDVLLFYFPDHGLDLFDTDEKYCGHVRDMVQESWDVCNIIPFFIYVPEPYRAAHPEQVEKLEHAVNRPFNTGDMLYTLMQLTGWEAEGKAVKGRGLLEE